MSMTPAFNEKKYKRLLADALPCVIRDDAEYERLLAILHTIEHTAAEQEISPEEERLSDLLFALIEPYEEQKFQEELPRSTPLEFLKACMVHRELTQKDVWHLFGSKGIASEVLNGKRSISKTHARKLAAFFAVDVGAFIGEKEQVD